MTHFHSAILCAALLVAAPLLKAQANDSTIVKEIQNLRSVSTAQRPAVTSRLPSRFKRCPPENRRWLMPMRSPTW